MSKLGERLSKVGGPLPSDNRPTGRTPSGVVAARIQAKKDAAAAGGEKKWQAGTGGRPPKGREAPYTGPGPAEWIKHLDSLPSAKHREDHLAKMPKENVKALYDHMADEPGAHKSAGSHGDMAKMIAERTGTAEPARPIRGANLKHADAPLGIRGNAPGAGKNREQHQLQQGAKGGSFYTTATGRKIYAKT